MYRHFENNENVDKQDQSSTARPAELMVPSAGLDRGPDRIAPVEIYNHAGVDRIGLAEPRILRRDGQ